jgi:hypothetical protein
VPGGLRESPRPDCGGDDGIAWYIDRETTDIASGSISNCESKTRLSHPITVHRGMTLYFLIDPKANYSFELTEIDLTIYRPPVPPSLRLREPTRRDPALRPADRVLDLRKRARSIRSSGQAVEEPAHQVTAAIVEALDLIGIFHRVLRRVLDERRTSVLLGTGPT